MRRIVVIAAAALAAGALAHAQQSSKERIDAFAKLPDWSGLWEPNVFVGEGIGQSLSASGFYDVIGHVENHGEIEQALRSGAAKVALVIPAGYSTKLLRKEPASLQLIVDGSDPQTVASATNTAASLASAKSTQLLLQRLGPAGALGPPLQLEPSTWYNPELRTAVFVVPGLVGVILTMTRVMLTSMAIARERVRGTLEQLIVSQNVVKDSRFLMDNAFQPPIQARVGVKFIF